MRIARAILDAREQAHMSLHNGTAVLAVVHTDFRSFFGTARTMRDRVKAAAIIKKALLDRHPEITVTVGCRIAPDWSGASMSIKVAGDNRVHQLTNALV